MFKLAIFVKPWLGELSWSIGGLLAWALSLTLSPYALILHERYIPLCLILPRPYTLEYQIAILDGRSSEYLPPPHTKTLGLIAPKYQPFYPHTSAYDRPDGTRHQYACLYAPSCKLPPKHWNEALFDRAYKYLHGGYEACIDSRAYGKDAQAW